MNILTNTKQTTSKARSVASGIGALALSTLMAMTIGGATTLAQSGPVITLTPGEYEGRTTLQGTASETVTNWEYLRSSNNFDCVAATFEQHTPVSDLNYIFVPDDKGDITYCFRAKNADDVWGYAQHRFDFNHPEVTEATLNSREGQSTVALAASEPVTFHYHITAGSDCDADSATWADQPTGSEVTVHEVTNICFQLTDESGKTAYYLYEVTSIKPLVAPKVLVSYHASRDKVEATANKSISIWAFVVSTDAPVDCEDINYGTPTGRLRVADYTPSNVNQHYYFQGTDSEGQKACGKLTILAAIVNPTPPVTTPPTTTPPTTTPPTSVIDAPEIEITASGRQITASHSEPVAKWRYYRSPATPICSSDVVWDVDQNPSVVKGRQVTGLTDSDVGRWVCFRALLLGTEYRGQEVYKAVQITDNWSDPNNTQTLTITFQQSPTTLTATASPAVASDRFQYLAYSGEQYPEGPNCQRTNPHMTAEYWQRYNAKTGNVVNLVPAAEGYFYCFRVTDDAGGASYGMYRVGGIKKTIKTKPVEKTETPPVTTTTTTTPPATTIEVEISQSDSTLTATTNPATSGANWQSLKFSGDRYPDGPNCSNDNPHMTAEYWDSWNTGNSNTVTLKASDEGYFYCFRVTDDDGNVAIGQHKVTEVEVAQEQTQTESNQTTNQNSNQTTTGETTTTNTDGSNQAAPVVNVVNTAPTVPAPQVTVTPGPAPQITVTTQAPESQPIPIDLTVNIPESTKTEAPKPVQDPKDDDDSVTQGLLWGLGGAIVTLAVLTAVLAIIDRSRRH